MENIFYAKSVLPNGAHPTNREHLKKVRDMAMELGQAGDIQDEAGLAGLFHDFGKYSPVFQQVLCGDACHIDHAAAGAAILYHLRGKNSAFRPVIEAVNGHHDGLLEYDVLAGMLKEILCAQTEVQGNAGKTASLWGIAQFQAAVRAFRNDFPALSMPKLQKENMPPMTDSVASMLYTRMLFSCLVDADYTVSARDEDPTYAQDEQSLELRKLLETLENYRQALRESSQADTNVNVIRDAVYDQCGVAGYWPEGLFTLTAPTGTGKTLALLYFALRHCVRWDKRRIIVVLPYLTLAEQNATIYEKIIPGLLVDHSQRDLPDDQRKLAERWSAPVILTTSVRFFESLFAARPTDCRRLHQLANSVVVFDEAQSLPAEVTKCTLQAVRELCRRYHCTMVFSTATQPDFAQVDPAWQPREILPDNKDYYNAMRRVRVDWRLNEPVPLETLAEEMAEKRSVCAIVNMRSHAARLYRHLRQQCPDQEVFFITTDLCSDHRKQVVEQINQRLQDHLPCRVVATQCIEAGVDFDFDEVYRALAPLEAIIQAAGRCNRNGRLKAGGVVTVFMPDEERLYPETWYGNGAEIVREMVNIGPLDIQDPQCIQAYYKRLFSDQKDRHELTKALAERCYAKVDKEYQLIKNRGVRVVVPFKGQQMLYDQLKEELKTVGLTKAGMKRAAPLTVTSTEKDIEEYAESIPFAARKDGQRQYSDFYVLRAQYECCYTEDMGLQFSRVENINGFF
jgi:CRISPR-associated helicase Cas3/CRISPR-associated endonuclease Cas3-HD